MPTYTTQTEISIKRPALDIYNFTTTPKNWMGSHPVTGYVSGLHIHSPAGVGATWHEHIKSPVGEQTAEAIWETVEADPGRRWVIKSIYFDGLPIVVTITYTLTEKYGETTFHRRMATEAPRELPPEQVAALTDSRVHDAYLARVRDKLE